MSIATEERPQTQSAQAEKKSSSSTRGSGAPSSSGSGGPLRRAPGRIRVSRKEVVDLTTQLSIMIQTGVDVSSAMKACGRRSRKPVLRMMLDDIHDSVMSGNPLSESMKAYRDVFGDTFIASVAAGEASGRLPEVLGELAKIERGNLRLQSNIRTMLAYPIMLGSVSSLVLAALIFFVLPQFAQIFKQFDMPLPIVTQLLIGFASELRIRWWLWIPLAIGGLVGLIVFKRSPRGREFWDYFTLYTPIIRDVARNLQIGRTCRLLGLMVESGVPLLESIRLAKMASSSLRYQRLFGRLEEDVLNGKGLSSGLQAADFIPPGAADMLLTAERTGSIGPVTELIGGHYEEEGETKMKEIVTLLEPAITVGMGVIIAIVVSAVMLPMFDMASVSSGK